MGLFSAESGFQKIKARTEEANYFRDLHIRSRDETRVPNERRQFDLLSVEFGSVTDCARITGKREVTTSRRIDTTRKISFGTEQLESLGSKAAETQGLAC